MRLRYLEVPLVHSSQVRMANEWCHAHTYRKRDTDEADDGLHWAVCTLRAIVQVHSPEGQRAVSGRTVQFHSILHV